MPKKKASVKEVPKTEEPLKTEDAAEPPFKVSRMSREEFVKFVDAYCSGTVFTSDQIPASQMKSLMGLVFMPLSLGLLDKVSKEEIQNIRVVYEYLSEAGPRSINRMPIFFSCRFIHKDDTEKLNKAVAAEFERRKGIGAMFDESKKDEDSEAIPPVVVDTATG